MGRNGAGFTTTATSIRVDLSVAGQRIKGTLAVGGKALRPTVANLRFAERAIADIRAAARSGTFRRADWFTTDDGAPAGAMTVGQLLDDWITTVRAQDSTLDNHARHARFWKTNAAEGRPPLGEMFISKVRPSDIRRVLAARSDLSEGTLNNRLNTLRMAFAQAVEDQLLTATPVEDVKRLRYSQRQPDPFTADEREIILRALRERYDEQIANMGEFWFWTGMRTAEIFGLRWQSVGLAAREALVCEQRTGGEQKARTKTGSDRVVRINSRALAALERQRKHTQLAGENVWRDPRNGKPWRKEDAFRAAYWAPTLKLLGLRYRRPYQMRHTYATQMLMAGMNPAFCAGQLGHSVDLFLTTYAKWISGDADEAQMRILEAALSENSPKIPPQASAEST